jgi:hypothetical protein
MDTAMNAFDKLEFDDKAEIIRAGGEPIVTVTFFNYYVTLYAVDGFLAERYYNTETKSTARISSVEFRDLEKYLSHISITEILPLL